MTTLSLVHPETKEVLDTFNLDALVHEVEERFQLNLAHFFPMAHMAEDWYNGSLQASLKAVEDLLLRLKDVLHFDDKLTIKAVDDLEPEEAQVLKRIPHSDGITIHGKAHVSFRMPHFEDNPALDALIADFKHLVAFAEHGRDQGSHLANSDYPEDQAVEPVGEEVSEPGGEPVTPTDIPIAIDTTGATSEEDVLTEALAPVEN